MITPLLEQVLVGADAPIATGTTEQFSSYVDTSACDGVLFIVRLGSPAANNIVRAQQNTVSSGGSPADLAGSAIVSGTSNVIVIDVARPTKQFVRVAIARGTTTTVDSIVAIRYGAHKQPTTQPSGVLAEANVGSAEGTA